MNECPICKVEMAGMVGCKGHIEEVGYGYSLYCLNLECSAQEVMGHGKNEKEAYEVVTAKFNRKK